MHVEVKLYKNKYELYLTNHITASKLHKLFISTATIISLLIPFKKLAERILITGTSTETLMNNLIYYKFY